MKWIGDNGVVSFVELPEEPVESVELVTRSVPRIVVILGGTAAALISLVLLKEIGGVVAPLFLALNLVITAYPVHRWLVSKGTPAWLSALVMVLTVMVALIGAVAGLAWSVSAMVDAAPEYSDDFFRFYNLILARLDAWGYDQQALQGLMTKIDPNSAVSFLTGLVSSASGVLGLIAVIMAAMIFMVMDTPSFDRRLQAVERQRPEVYAALFSFAGGVRKYWLVTTIFGLIVAVLDWIGLVIMGVPLAMVWALLAFLTNYIPNIGFVIGLVPPALIALFAVGWKTAIAVVVVYSVLNFVVQSIIQPRFTGESVGVTPTISFISLLVWGWVLGGLGTLIALPMTLLVKAIIIDLDPASRWFNALVSSRKESYEAS